MEKIILQNLGSTPRELHSLLAGFAAHRQFEAKLALSTLTKKGKVKQKRMDGIIYVWKP